MTVYQNDRDDPNYVFTYDETSKSCLRWKNPRRNSTLVGKEAGTLKVDNRWAITFRGQQLLVSSIILEMFDCEIKDKRDTIHHKNEDSSDCRLDNLYIKHYKDKNWQDEFIINREFKTVFDYRDGELYWTDERWWGWGLKIRRRASGDRLRYKYNKYGYRECQCAGKHYRVHRMIYEWHNGPMDSDLCIDHINGDPSDNRIENLRAVNNAVNSRNTKIQSNNQTGVLGVRYRVCNKVGTPYYIATWQADYKTRQKSFSVNKYGEQQAFQLACDYRDKMIAKLNEKLGDEGYHENHGRR